MRSSCHHQDVSGQNIFTKWLGVAACVLALGQTAQASDEKESKPPTESTLMWMWNDFSSPVRPDTRPLVEIGGLLTLGLYLLKPTVIEPMQRDVHSGQPLGESSKYGDLSGQWIPNV